MADKTKTGLGGLSGSVGYALENEAYCTLLSYLKNLDIDLTERFVRTVINGEEINILGKRKRNGQELIIVGIPELKLTRDVGALNLTPLQKFERKVNTVRKKYPTEEIFKIIVTHFARSEIIEKARGKGITKRDNYSAEFRMDLRFI